ncbi:HAD family hydrolase [Neorhodopirellula lusitana]|uniref:HAD family hydrolase n=1 Tax=Neorhodopirellula lusitana TaxID=445327 RepID=UPI00384F92CB
MTASQIRFVFFDLGNILVSFERERSFRNLTSLFEAESGYVDSNGNTVAANVKADEVLNQHELHNQLETGLISEAEFVQSIRDRFAPVTGTDDDQAILRAISDMFTPIETMQGVLSRVRESGLPIGILSNTCDAHWSWINQQSYNVMEGPFDHIVLSYEAKSMKPDHAIYIEAETHAARISGAQPNEILFLDDREENVAAALDRGWNAEVCWGGPTAEAALVRHGVLSHQLLTETEMDVQS